MPINASIEEITGRKAKEFENTFDKCDLSERGKPEQKLHQATQAFLNLEAAALIARESAQVTSFNAAFQ